MLSTTRTQNDRCSPRIESAVSLCTSTMEMAVQQDQSYLLVYITQWMRRHIHMLQVDSEAVLRKYIRRVGISVYQSGQC